MCRDMVKMVKRGDFPLKRLGLCGAVRVFKDRIKTEGGAS
jgi:hypothetical protein